MADFMGKITEGMYVEGHPLQTAFNYTIGAPFIAGKNAGEAVIEGITDAVSESDIGQTISDTKDDVDNFVNDAAGNNTNLNHFEDTVDDFHKVAKLGVGVAGAVGGWALGSKFGAAGKVVGGVLGICLAPKLVDLAEEIGKDAAAATDYVQRGEKEGAKRNWFKAFGNNLLNFGGQTYNGGCDLTSAEEASLD